MQPLFYHEKLERSLNYHHHRLRCYAAYPTAASSACKGERAMIFFPFKIIIKNKLLFQQCRPCLCELHWLYVSPKLYFHSWFIQDKCNNFYCGNSFSENCVFNYKISFYILTTKIEEKRKWFKVRLWLIDIYSYRWFLNCHSKFRKFLKNSKLAVIT